MKLVKVWRSEWLHLLKPIDPTAPLQWMAYAHTFYLSFVLRLKFNFPYNAKFYPATINELNNWDAQVSFNFPGVYTKVTNLWIKESMPGWKTANTTAVTLATNLRCVYALQGHRELLQLYDLPSNTSLHSALSHTALADTIALKPHLYGTSIKLVKLLAMKLNFHMKLNCVCWHTFSRIQKCWWFKGILRELCENTSASTALFHRWNRAFLGQTVV